MSDWGKRPRELLADEPGLKRGDPIICDDCGKETPRARLETQGAGVTDQDGHYHDNNLKCSAYRCACGWEKFVTFRIPCPVTGCDGRSIK